MRAERLSAEERRAAILAATRPLLIEHGRATTTRLIAEAAGIAEGTIFRVFATKDQLFDAVLDQAFDPHQFVEDIGSIPLDQPLRDRLVDLTRTMQRRFVEIFTLMIAMALPKPPHRHDGDEQWRRRAGELMVALVEPDADAFRVPPDEVVRMLRLLTFSGSHPHLSEGNLLTPDQIVDTILHGTLKEHR